MWSVMPCEPRFKSIQNPLLSMMLTVAEIILFHLKSMYLYLKKPIAEKIQIAL